MRSFVVRACSARDLHAHQVRATVVNLGYNSSILSEWLGIFNRIHLQHWCVKARKRQIVL